MTFDRDKMKSDLAALAAAGVFLGTSSWKYPGWLGQLYTRDRYVWRGHCTAITPRLPRRLHSITVRT